MNLIGNILISSCSSKVSLINAIKEQVKCFKNKPLIIGGDIDQQVPTRYILDHFWLMPKTEDKYFEDIKSVCIKKGINYIFPTRDGELTFWAKHRQEFLEQNISVIVSDEEGINLCLDKLTFSTFGQSKEFNFIPSYLNIDRLEVERVVVKERYGSGSRNIGCHLTKAQALEFSKTLINPIFQPHISGTEISIDAWIDKGGTPKGLITRTRDKVKNGESEITTTFRSKEIEKDVANILKSLKLRGPVVMQGIIDENNKLHILECNPRIGGASTISINVGLELIRWSLLMDFSNELDIFKRECFEVKQVKLTTDLIINDTNI